MFIRQMVIAFCKARELFEANVASVRVASDPRELQVCNTLPIDLRWQRMSPHVILELAGLVERHLAVTAVVLLLVIITQVLVL